MAESAKRVDGPKNKPLTSSVREQGRPERGTVQELKQRIEERVRTLEPTSGDGTRRARRIFLESVIVWEFGDQLLLDGQLDRLVDSIQDAVATDPELDRQFDNLLDQLSKG